ncbi:heat shock protein 110, putative [Plasmodium knowlesi strain H]|uniref:Heat shock protein 110, putative n=3 Tax=Plasmodium knowlesi TaxID=5850 RepID=A0A5K1VUM0_PLAKH|nr:endoplasmic reticulum chaperone GRP170, putative [Plasmodium knowlesi strain H]OTN66431.1 putative Heat shock protein 110 [Plasmodium knowlesi]CAA9989897.1 endoplasmic reticulum chaperone GRP170, putative [Plasmodium knowlesi strain H]SBO24461.1 heat shock protein 110, putative [Plasmodium knowlesi strain H]SBO26531.1 heat shock protein 110, putative [Plasmodium knowlesi strain H]VVS79371.1 endoplasmic reticulum chaperone GRP170, putative [Plasmodium knowlesi strain H]|eukprot:XP_002259913.1 hsp protein, putative [Plasmodium knowlesi strain H]
MKRTLLLALGILSLLNQAIVVKGASVLGIDFGNEYIKVSIVSPGKGFNILLNNQSKRKITNAISFSSKVRTFDEEAKIYSAKHPHLTIQNGNNYLAYNIFDALKNKENFNAENYDESNEDFYADVNNYEFHQEGDATSKYFDHDYVVDHKRGTISLKLKNDMVLSSEEITANILGYIKKLAYNHLNVDYKTKRSVNVHIGCVISIPCNYPQRKKEALLNATKIAGLELLGLVNGVTAAAIHNVHDLPLNTTKLTMYLDVGSKNINVGIGTISHVEKDKVKTRSVKMYACEVIENKSGNQIDVLLAEHLRKKFEEKYNLSIYDDRKAMRKLVLAANKAKLLLSAKKSTDVFIESLYKNKSLNETVTRQEFEDLIEEVILNFKVPINNALKRASFELKDIEALELIGAAWRVPKVLNEITAFFNPLTVGMHLNSDEAVTMGSLYIAAYNSANFRLKDLNYTDILSNEYHILVRNGEEDQTSDDQKNPKEIIAYNSRYPLTKSVILKYKENVKFSILENGKVLNEYSVNPIDEATKKKYEKFDHPKLSLEFQLDKFGILTLENAFLIYEEKKEVETSAEKSDEQEKKEESNVETSEETPGDVNIDATGEGKATDKEATKEEATEADGKKTQVVKHSVKVTYQVKNIKPTPLTNEEVSAKKDILKKMDEHDINIFLKSERKNKLESFIYESRSKMKQDIFKQVCKEDTRTEYLNKLEEYEEWLYTENDEPLENVSNKIRELEDVYFPIKERAEELQVREKLIKDTNAKIMEMQQKVIEYTAAKPWAEETIKVVRDSLEKAVEWWKDAQEEQKKLDNYSPPFFKAKEVEMKFKSIHLLIRSLEKIKKPAEKKEKKEKKGDENAASSAKDKKNNPNDEQQSKDESQNDNSNENKGDSNEGPDQEASEAKDGEQKGESGTSTNESSSDNNGSQEQKDEL